MRELATEAMTTEERREMMAITTKSSIKVNPLFLEQLMFPVYQKVFFEQRKKEYKNFQTRRPPAGRSCAFENCKIKNWKFYMYVPNEK